MGVRHGEGVLSNELLDSEFAAWDRSTVFHFWVLSGSWILALLVEGWEGLWKGIDCIQAFLAGRIEKARH